jgi:hypothetical protein
MAGNQDLGFDVQFTCNVAMLISLSLFLFSGSDFRAT